MQKHKTLSLLILLIAICTFSFKAQADILNVPEQFVFIQQAVQRAQDGDTVLVAPGVYQNYISYSGKPILVASNFIFSGDEADIEQTIIDGSNMNAKLVYFDEGETRASILDGFTLRNSRMSAIYIVEASPSLRNLRIIDCNNESGGAGISATTNCQPIIENVLLLNNRSQHSGGSIASIDNCDLTMINVIFESNQSERLGGGMYLEDSHCTMDNVLFVDNLSHGNCGGCFLASSIVEMNETQFINNLSHSAGGGLYLDSSIVEMNEILFCGNQSANGGGIYANHFSRFEGQGLVVEGNSATNYGGGFILAGSSILNLSASTFSQNSTDGSGGALWISTNAICILADCVFNENSAGRNGGAVGAPYHCRLQMTGCQIENNQSVAAGAGVFCNGEISVSIINCHILNNNCDSNGGGIYCNRVVAMAVEDCLIAGNSGSQGAAIYILDANQISVLGSVIANNTGEEISASIFAESTPLTIRNSILWNPQINEIEALSGSVYLDFDLVGIDLEHLNRQYVHVGEGVVCGDPMFRDIENEDFHLTQLSPCINAADPNLPSDADGSRADLGLLPYLWGTVDGFVRDAETNEGISGAVVSINGKTNLSVTTERDGYFLISPAGPDPFVLQVSKSGYSSSELDSVFVRQNDNTEVLLPMAAGQLSLNFEQVHVELAADQQTVIPISLHNDGMGNLDFSTEKRLAGENYLPLWEKALDVDLVELTGIPRFYGVAYGEERFFVSGNTDIHRPQIYIFSREGALLDSFPQPLDAEATFGFKDIDWDGELLWGAYENHILGFTTEGEVIHQFDVNLMNNILMACDPVERIIWTGYSVSDITGYTYEGDFVRAISRDGLRLYGLAFNHNDADHLPLYLVTRDPNSQINKYWKIDPISGNRIEFTEPSFVNSQESTISGIAISSDYSRGNIVLCQIDRTENSSLVVFPIYTNTAWFDIDPIAGSLQPGESSDFSLTFDAAQVDSGIWEGEILFNHPQARGLQTILPLNLCVDCISELMDTGNMLPTIPILSPPYPNPFNSTTTIGYSLPVAGNVSLAVYDLSGREVTRLVDGEQSAGMHNAVWTADNVSSGVYFLTLRGNDVCLTQKLLLVR